MKHSPEPWEVTEVGAGEFFIVKYEKGGDGWEFSVGEIDRKQDAERIVACVNACQGLPTVNGELSLVADMKAAILSLDETILSIVRERLREVLK